MGRGEARAHPGRLLGGDPGRPDAREQLASGPDDAVVGGEELFAVVRSVHGDERRGRGPVPDAPALRGAGTAREVPESRGDAPARAVSALHTAPRMGTCAGAVDGTLDLVLLACFVLLPWRAGAAAGGLIALYAGLGLVTGRVGDGPAFLARLVHLAAMGAVGVVAVGLRERLGRRGLVSLAGPAGACRRQKDLAAGWSHEVRNRVNVVIGYADILLDGGLERDAADARQLVERIRSHSVRLRTLISERLDDVRAGTEQTPYLRPRSPCEMTVTPRGEVSAPAASGAAESPAATWSRPSATRSERGGPRRLPQGPGGGARGLRR
jgi:hypothetical protein